MILYSWEATALFDPEWFLQKLLLVVLILSDAVLLSNDHNLLSNYIAVYWKFLRLEQQRVSLENNFSLASPTTLHTCFAVSSRFLGAVV